MQPVSIIVVTTKKQLKEFIYLPEKIHKDHANWLPPIYMDEFQFFDPEKNHAFTHCDTILYLAYRGNELVGRIMGIIHHEYNKIHSEKTGRFGFIECYNDEEVAFALIGKVESWARNLGMIRMIGPYGFSDKDPQGLQISGFEHMPVIAAPVNFPYMVSLVEKFGYKKEIDCFVTRLDLSKPFPEVYNRIRQRFESRNDFKFKEFKRKSDFKPFIKPILQLVNETYSDLYGFFPLSEIEMKEFAAKYIEVLDPHFVKAILKNGEVVAFIIGIPNFTPGIQKSRGRLFPFGFIHILRSMKTTKQLDLMLGAVNKAYQGLGFEILMAMELVDSCRKAGLTVMEIHLVLETNFKMLAELERVEARRIKEFRVFYKNLT